MGPSSRTIQPPFLFKPRSSPHWQQKHLSLCRTSLHPQLLFLIASASLAAFLSWACLPKSSLLCLLYKVEFFFGGPWTRSTMPIRSYGIVVRNFVWCYWSGLLMRLGLLSIVPQSQSSDRDKVGEVWSKWLHRTRQWLKFAKIAESLFLKSKKLRQSWWGSSILLCGLLGLDAISIIRLYIINLRTPEKASNAGFMV
jgi:hypothetical protein